jgi:hypothetical protein
VGTERLTRGEDRPAATSWPNAAAAPADALRRLGRSAGNRATARLLQRWVDDKGKWYPGTQPPDAENWERFTHSSGQERWRPKTVAAPTVATTVTAAPETKPAAATTAVKTEVAATAPAVPDVSDSKTEWWTNPASVRYSQDTCGAKFTNGTPVDQAARSLKNSPKTISEWPTLLLRKKGGRLVSLDNRRLWVFKHAQVPLCKVRWASEEEWKAQNWKMTASGKDGSAFIGVKGPPILNMKDLPTFTPPPSFNRVPAAQYV